jgi:hypothetical protein
MARATVEEDRARLREVPVEDVRQALRERKSEALEAYLKVHLTEVSAQERSLAILDLGMVVMAEYGLSPESGAPRNPFSTPGWLIMTREAISGYIAEDPENRNILEGSIYLKPNRQLEKQLNHLVSGSVTPGGAYSDQEFASGVATSFLRAAA